MPGRLPRTLTSDRFHGLYLRHALKFPLSDWSKPLLPLELWPEASGKFGPSGRRYGQQKGLNNPGDQALSSSRNEHVVPAKLFAVCQTLWTEHFANHSPSEETHEKTKY
jgi:hypothetical protein